MQPGSPEGFFRGASTVTLFLLKWRDLKQIHSAGPGKTLGTG